MIRLIKNNVLPGTFASITILFLATYDMGVKSLSALWYTDMWMLYTVVLSLNGILFMIGDNQIINKIAGFLLLTVVLFPISSVHNMTPSMYRRLDTSYCCEFILYS